MSADTKLVKTPHQQENYTPDQLIELAKCANDPKYFMRTHCWIQHPTKGRMKFELFDFQEEFQIIRVASSWFRACYTLYYSIDNKNAISHCCDELSINLVAITENRTKL